MDQELEILKKIIHLPRFSKYRKDFKKCEVFRSCHGGLVWMILVDQSVCAPDLITPIKQLLELMQLQCEFDFCQYSHPQVFKNAKALCFDPKPTSKKLFDAMGIKLDAKGYIIG